MAFVRVEQRNAHLAGPVRLEFVSGRDGKVAKGTVTAISNTRRGSGEQREEQATAIQWTLWGKQAENAAQYLGKVSRVNVIGRLQNNNYEKDGATVYAMAFTAEEIDYLDSRAGTEALRARQGQPGDRSGAARATPPVAREQVPKARLGRTALAEGRPSAMKRTTTSRSDRTGRDVPHPVPAASNQAGGCWRRALLQTAQREDPRTNEVRRSAGRNPTSACRRIGTSTSSSTAPSNGRAKFAGSSANNASSAAAGSSQCGRFGCRSANHSSPKSCLPTRHSNSSRFIEILPLPRMLAHLTQVQCGASSFWSNEEVVVRHRYVTRRGRDLESNVHAYWDTRLVRLLGADPTAVASTLTAAITPADVLSWERGSAAPWATESFAQARDITYAYADQGHRVDSHGVQCTVLDAAYDSRSLPVVRQQLSKAGIRLAKTLTDSLR